MRLFGFEITRAKSNPIGDVSAQALAIVELQKRVDKLEHHRTAVAVKTLKEEDAAAEIRAILAGGGVKPDDPGVMRPEQLNRLYQRNRQMRG